MMPKEPLLKENSPIKKQLDVSKNNNPSNPNAMNSLFHVSILLTQITLKSKVKCKYLLNSSVVFL